MINRINGFNIGSNKKAISYKDIKNIKPAKKSNCISFKGFKLNDCEIGLIRKINSVFKIGKKQQNHLKNEIECVECFIYEDDRIFGIDGCLGNKNIRDDIRERIFMATALNDDELAVRNLDDNCPISPQLSEQSKYYALGVPKFSEKKEKYFYVCENLKDMPDMNGLRGKTPLSGRNAVATRFKLSQIKDSGINTIIDLRSNGECSSKSLREMKKLGMQYINFPVEDKNWDIDKLCKITEFIKTVNKGDFYLGCANGEARTDLAVAINYIFNPDSENVPKLYFGSAKATRVSIKENLSQILDIVESNKEIIKKWGWSDYDEFIHTVSLRLNRILETLKS